MHNSHMCMCAGVVLGLAFDLNIFGIKKNLYNKNISVVFSKFIRPEKKFNNITELKDQIRKDIKQAK